MKIYLDKNNMCHREHKEGYIEAEHDFFDTVCPVAIECYKFIPESDFIQCVDAKSAEAYEKLWHEIYGEGVATIEDYQNSLARLGVDMNE